MSPLMISCAQSRLKPGRLLDVGARDCLLSRPFAELGYQVDAIDPFYTPDPDGLAGITYHRTSLEAFEPVAHYDLVLASFVSHLVSYDPPGFLQRLKALTKSDGLIYATLLGDEDEWASLPTSKAVSFDQADAIVRNAALRPLYRCAEWYDGPTYAGEPKFWHVLRFMLCRQDAR